MERFEGGGKIIQLGERNLTEVIRNMAHFSLRGKRMGGAGVLLLEGRKKGRVTASNGVGQAQEGGEKGGKSSGKRRYFRD